MRDFRFRPVPSPQPRPAGRLRIPCALALFGVLASSMLGCANPLGRVDAHTDRLLRERSEELGGGAVAPKVRDRSISTERSSGRYRTSLPTANPGASSLSFRPALADRDVADRLERYARESLPMPGEASGQGVRTLTLSETFRLTQSSGREFRFAEEDYILAAIRLLIERHLWSPRLFNDTTARLSGSGTDGRFEHALDLINTLRVTKRLPYGGEVEARWVVNATEQLRTQATGRYRQSSELALSGNIPLLRGAGQVARESRIQAERNLIYAARNFERFRRSLLVDIAADFFALIQSRDRIANQVRQIEGLKRDNEATGAKVRAGRLRAFQQQITASRLSQAQQQLARLRESYILQLDRFKLRLGLNITDAIDIDPAIFDVLEPDTTLREAMELALEYRLDLQNRRDQLDDQRRAVANARNDLLPDLNLDGTVSIPTDPLAREGGVLIQPEELNYSVGATFSLPLDRRIERLNVRQAIVGLERAQRAYDEFRDNVIIAGRQAVRNVDLARFQLQLAEEQVRINELGLEELLLRDDSDPQSVVDRRIALLTAENARDQAIADLRNAILNFLLATGQARVRADGTFEPLPGMVEGEDAAPAAGDELDDMIPVGAP